MVKIALHQFEIGDFDFWQKTEDALTRASAAGADMYVQPEMCTFQLLHPNRFPEDPGELMVATAQYAEHYLSEMQTLARQFGLYIVAGSIPAQAANGKLYNIAYVIAPDGRVTEQGKCHLTSWEVDLGISPYPELRIFESDLGTFGIAICYDVEMPELVRKTARHGATFLVAPTFTESIFGSRRVTRTAAAAAEYNQMYVLQCAVCGTLAHPDLAESYGQSVAFTPSYPGFPIEGYLAHAPANQEHLLIAELDLAQIEQYRQPGYVSPLHDSAVGERVPVHHVAFCADAKQ